MNRNTKRLISLLVVIIIAFFPLACSSDAQTENQQLQEDWIYFWEVNFRNGSAHSLQKEVNLVKKTDEALEFEGGWKNDEDNTQMVIKTVRLDTSHYYYTGQRLIADGDGSNPKVRPIKLRKYAEDCYFGEVPIPNPDQKLFIKLFRKGVECKRPD